MDAQIKKGVLDCCVLYAVSKGDSYGYKIVSDLKSIIDISESTLYPILRRLEALGALETYSAECGGRLRKYYKITPAGQARFSESKEDLKEVYDIYLKICGGQR